MNKEEDKKPLAVLASMALFICLAGITICSQIDKYPSETVEASETTECTVEATEASVETVAVTEPVTAATTLPVETSIDITEPIWTAPEAPSADDNLGLLACVIYQEAGGDAACDDCRRRVADVVLNRMASSYFPYTIHGVLTQEAQYGRFYWTGVVWPERANDPDEKEAVERAYRIAEEVLSGHHSELFGKGYIWQAEFIQGKDNVFCCGHYFGR